MYKYLIKDLVTGLYFLNFFDGGIEWTDDKSKSPKFPYQEIVRLRSVAHNARRATNLVYVTEV